MKRVPLSQSSRFRLFLTPTVGHQSIRLSGTEMEG